VALVDQLFERELAQFVDEKDIGCDFYPENQALGLFF